METPMTKADLLERIEQARAEWDDLVEQVSPAWMLLPGASGRWTLKDVIAHITWFEREMVVLLRKRALAGSDLWNLPPDERNAAIYREYRDRALEEVLAEAEQVFQALLREIDGLEEADLFQPGRFADMPPDWVPWQLLAENTYEHYQAHAPAVRAWLEEA